MKRVGFGLLLLLSAHVIGGQPMSPGATPASPIAPTSGPLSWSYGPYSYDPAGNITAIGNQYFVYDPMSRLVQSSTALAPAQQQQQEQEFTYDVYGNLTGMENGGIPTGTFTVDPATNRLTSLSYDAAGNTTAWQPQGSPHQRNYTYDALSRLVEERVTGSSDVTYHLYTADDERYWTYIGFSGGSESHFKIRDLDGKVLRDFQLGATWSVFRDYVYRDETLLAALSPAGNRHISVDHLGSPRLITSDSRFKAGAHTYYPFGGEWTDGTFQDNDVLKFTSHERDASFVITESNALDYMHARYYLGSLGRFASVDPLMDEELSQEGPQRWNRYSYVMGSPVGYVDPDGEAAVAVAGGAGVAVATAVVLWHTHQMNTNAEYRQAVTELTADLLNSFAEHVKGKRKSTRAKHQKGEGRKVRDRGGEKGDGRRRPPRKRPKGHKGPWPVKSEVWFGGSFSGSSLTAVGGSYLLGEIDVYSSLLLDRQNTGASFGDFGSNIFDLYLNTDQFSSERATACPGGVSCPF